MNDVIHDFLLLKINFNYRHIFETLNMPCSYLTIREKVNWKAGVKKCTKR